MWLAGGVAHSAPPASSSGEGTRIRLISPCIPPTLVGCPLGANQSMCGSLGNRAFIVRAPCVAAVGALHASANGLATGIAPMLAARTTRRREDRRRRVGSPTSAGDIQVLLDSVPAFIWYKDRENRILRANRLAAESMGMSVEQVEGRSAYDLYPDEAAKYHHDDLEVIRLGEPKLGIVEILTTASGEKRWVRTDKIPYRDEARGDRRCHRLRRRHLRARVCRGGPAARARGARASRRRAHAAARRHGRDAACGNGRAPAGRGTDPPAAGRARPRPEAAHGGGHRGAAGPRDQPAAGRGRELRPRAGAAAGQPRARRRIGPARHRPDHPGDAARCRRGATAPFIPAQGRTKEGALRSQGRGARGGAPDRRRGPPRRGRAAPRPRSTGRGGRDRRHPDRTGGPEPAAQRPRGDGCALAWSRTRSSCKR